MERKQSVIHSAHCKALCHLFLNKALTKEDNIPEQRLVFCTLCLKAALAVLYHRGLCCFLHYFALPAELQGYICLCLGMLAF